MLSPGAWPCGRRFGKTDGEVSAGLIDVEKRLLAVRLQHLVTGRRNLRAVLLKTGKNHEIALVDEAAAVALNVAAAGRLLLLRALALRLCRLLGESH